MPKLALLQFDTDPDCAARREALARIRATLVEDEPRWPAFFDTIVRQRPDAIVIACSVLPQHAREAARYLGDGFNTRNIPVFLVDVPSAQYNDFRSSAPRATIVENLDALAAAIEKSLATA